MLPLFRPVSFYFASATWKFNVIGILRRPSANFARSYTRDEINAPHMKKHLCVLSKRTFFLANTNNMTTLIKKNGNTKVAGNFMKTNWFSLEMELEGSDAARAKIFSVQRFFLFYTVRLFFLPKNGTL